MVKTDFSRIKELNKGNSESIYTIDPPIDTPDEVWFYTQREPFGTNVAIWQKGALVPRVLAVSDLPKGRTTRRETVYRLGSQLFVDIEVRGEMAIIRRGLLNGALHTSLVNASTVDSVLDLYRSLKFMNGTPWHGNPKNVMHRVHILENSVIDIWLDGNIVVTRPREGKPSVVQCKSREEAIGEIEVRLQKLTSKGYELRMMELLPAHEVNPPIKSTKPPAKKPPKISKTMGTPTNPFEAVDMAIDALRRLSERYPKGHLFVENLKNNDPRLKAEGYDGDFFVRLHKARFNRWNTKLATQTTLMPGESSFDYFSRRYGSLTWIARFPSEVLPTFYVEGINGGGLSPMQVDPNGTYDALDDLADQVKNPDLKKLLVFHGGWHDGYSFALDRRTAPVEGEYPIVPFDECDVSNLSKPAKKIQPFGNWLFARVKVLLSKAEPYLDEYQSLT